MRSERIINLDMHNDATKQHDAKCTRNITHTQRSANKFEVLGLLGPKPCKNCESRMSEANPRQSLVKGERLVRHEVNAVRFLLSECMAWFTFADPIVSRKSTLSGQHPRVMPP